MNTMKTENNPVNPVLLFSVLSVSSVAPLHDSSVLHLHDAIRNVEDAIVVRDQ